LVEIFEPLPVGPVLDGPLVNKGHAPELGAGTASHAAEATASTKGFAEKTARAEEQNAFRSDVIRAP
jgi:hypothetical protein